LDSIDNLIKQCQEQTALYSKGKSYDPTACYEIWRRAIVERDNEAWTALMEQYSGVVRNWLRQRLGGTAWLYYEEGVLINGVFANMYRFLTPEKFDRYTSLPAIMQYLKMCAGTAAVNLLRDMQAHQLDISLETTIFPQENAEMTLDSQLSDSAVLEDEVLERLGRAEFWQMVWRRLSDPVDRKLIWLRYVHDMSPREIVREYPQDFPEVTEVYRRVKKLKWQLRESS